MDIQAIPTTYNSIRYRSRLEARWAVFFDTLDLRVIYEYEGFQLPSGWYVPDFYAPDIQTWFEVKPENATEVDEQFCSELAEHLQQRVILLAGWPDWFQLTHGPDFGDDRFLMFTGDNCYQFCICPGCGKVGIEYNGRGARVCHHKHTPPHEHPDKAYSYDHPRILHAYAIAESYRFW